MNAIPHTGKECWLLRESGEPIGRVIGWEPDAEDLVWHPIVAESGDSVANTWSWLGDHKIVFGYLVRALGDDRAEVVES